jgi:hypothetical protein
MRARTSTVLLLVAVALSGCAAHDEDILVAPLGSTMQTCSSSPCTVVVTVGPGCAISTSAFTLNVDTGKDDELVTWRISPDSSGTVQFTTAGIDPKSGAWNSEFKNRAPGTTTYSWTDKNKNKKKPYGYNIFVTQNGTACAKYDPIIINN